MALLSDDLITQARNVTLLEYIQQHEPSVLKRVGAGRYVHKNHDSFVIDNGKGQWFWNSKGIGGVSAVDYLEKVEMMNFRAAVLELIGGTDDSHAQQSPARKITSPLSVLPNNVTAALDKLEKQTENKPFSLPTANKTNARVINYLQDRGIDKATIQKCISLGLLYESDKGSCVFVGRDKADGNKAKYAAERSTYGSIKKDVAGSDKRFGFCIPPENLNLNTSTFLAIFESSIDAMSHKDLLNAVGNEWDGHRLSLGGVVSKALNKFLEQNPGITHIWLCLDKDKSGHEASKRIIGELLQDPHHINIKITVSTPPLGKDWSDSLVAVRQMQRDIAQNHQKQTTQTQSHTMQDAFSL